MPEMDVGTLDKLIDEFDKEHEGIVALLQDVQTTEGYLPRPALQRIARRLELPLSQLYGLATFYKAFSLQPKGKHTITCCMGTACHVRGGQQVVDRLQRELGVAPGQTTPDMKFTLETVNCLGACALGPLVVVDGKYHGRLTPAKISRLLEQCE